MARLLAMALAASTTVSASRIASAQEGALSTAPAPAPAPAPRPPADGATPAPSAPVTSVATTPAAPEAAPGIKPSVIDPEKALPPPINVVYFQYGVALTAEVVSAAGPICDNVTVPCILGPGGGIAVRAGWRGAGPLYLGGAYEFSKQDPNKLLRLAILQQLRAEGRYYFVSGRETEPYVSAGLGAAGYGNEWTVDTWGPAGFLGLGVEAQLTRRTVVGVALAYRLLYFQSFVDSSGSPRDSGAAQLVGLDLVLEQREPIYTERKGRALGL